MTIDFLLTVLAFVLFVFSALQVPSHRVNLVPAGLACLTLTLLV